MKINERFYVHPFLKRADLIVADLTITESREKVVDFTVPYMYYTEDILMKKTSSKNEGINLLQFMNPFHRNVWFATLVSLGVTSVAVFVINYYSPYGYKDGSGQGTSDEFSFSNSVWFALACMLQQGAENTPRNLSGKSIHFFKLIKRLHNTFPPQNVIVLWQYLFSLFKVTFSLNCIK